ncbi:MAG TPA: cellulose biosynthesis cyclic di-GMP-binding regulatory protein BcsB [Anaerolineales bacterium]|nr:cellulose biosynthesis cyclic di-GMP-binding regulatory protein BcsB [Anaerolineales bacterium]
MKSISSKSRTFALTATTIAAACLTLLALFCLPSPAQAQPPQQATPAPQPTVGPGDISDTTNAFSFTTLGLTDRLMHGPYDSYRVRFSLPMNWSLSEGAEIQLHLNPFFTNALGEGGHEVDVATGGALDVTFNDELLTTIILDWSGPRVISIPIPAEALTPARTDGRHELYIFLDAAIDCELDHKTTLGIDADSIFILPHALADAPADLRLLPRPLYQANPLMPSTTLLIVPDQPSAAELQAALTIAAGFGRITAGNMPIQLLSLSQLTPELQANAHLVFVGRPEGLPILSSLDLPAPWSPAGFSILEALPSDGILQMAVSTWNRAYVALVVSGNSDEGVIKAAQALSSSYVRPGALPNLAIVADVEKSIAIPAVAEDRTFADLGYDAVTETGYSLHYTEFVFFIPPGQVTTDEAFFDLVFASSAMLNYDRSGLVVYLNDQIIGSLRFTDETTQVTTQRIQVPAFSVRSGYNSLMLVSELVPLDYCSELVLNNLWVSYSPTSLLHLPLVPASDLLARVQGLNTYPFPFVNSPTLEQLGFILPLQDAVAWNTAAQIAADLGQKSNGALVALQATFADQPVDALPANVDWLIVGRASSLPILQTIHDALPASFDPGSDLANESSFQVTYRLPAGTSLGYLEYLLSPWESQRSILAALGSTDQGLAWVSQALTTPSLSSKLAGDFAVINGEQILTADTRLGLGSGNLGATAAPATTLVPTPYVSQPVVVERPGWLLPAIVASGVLIAVVVVIAVISAIRKR